MGEECVVTKESLTSALAPGTTMMVFSPCLSTVMTAKPVTSSLASTCVRSTPLACK